MDVDPEDWVVEIARRCGRLLTGGVLTMEEAIGKVFHEFANDGRSAIHLAAAVWALVPQVARAEFIRKVGEALQPEFRLPPTPHHSGRVFTEEELRREADERTARVRAWAEQFRQIWAEGTDPA